MTAKCVSETETLTQELDILRNVLLLARGPSDSLFNRVDEALRTANVQKMREAKDSFDRLSDNDKAWILGVTYDDQICGN